MTSHARTFVLGLLLLAAAGPGAADDRLPMCAKIPSEPAVEADREAVDYSVGLIFREYDLNDDGHPDFMTARQIDRMTVALPDEDGPAQIRPLFYWVDRDADSAYEEMWVDQGGGGRCDEIVLYLQNRLLFMSRSER